jgi:hypothetical protein
LAYQPDSFQTTAFQTIPKTATVGLASETSTSFLVGRSKRKVATLWPETDFSVPLTRQHRRQLGTAQPETDTAQPPTRRKQRTILPWPEQDFAATLGISRAGGIGFLPEQDTSIGIGGKRKVKALAAATPENDTPLALTRRHERLLIPTGEFNFGALIPRVKRRLLGIQPESDTVPAAVGRQHLRLLSGTLEQDFSRVFAPAKSRLADPATEQDTALPIQGFRGTFVTAAASLEEALPVICQGLRTTALLITMDGRRVTLVTTGNLPEVPLVTTSGLPTAQLTTSDRAPTLSLTTAVGAQTVLTATEFWS